MKLSLFIFLIFASYLSFCQKINILENWSDSSSLIGICETDEINSSSLSNRFITPLFTQNYLPKTTISEQEKKLNPQNSFHLLSKRNLFFLSGKSLFKEKKLFWGIAINQEYQTNIRFSADAFKLIFIGNQPYAGKKLDIGNFYYHNRSFDNIQLLLQHHFINKNNHHRLGLNLGFLMIKNLQLLQTKNTSLYTAPQGDYLDINTNYTYINTPSKVYYNSFGANIESYYCIQTKKISFALLLRNINIIPFTKSFSRFSNDTNFIYNGLDITDLSNFNQPQNLQDSIYIKFTSPNNSSQSLLPVSNPELICKFKHQLIDSYSYELELILNKYNFMPLLIFEKNMIYLPSNWRICLSLIHGRTFAKSESDISYLDFGVGIERNFSNGLISIEFPYIKNIFSSKNIINTAISITLLKKFNHG